MKSIAFILQLHAKEHSEHTRECLKIKTHIVTPNYGLLLSSVKRTILYFTVFVIFILHIMVYFFLIAVLIRNNIIDLFSCLTGLE